MTPIEQSHYDYITSEVIPMTDDQRAADHADISVRFAWDILKTLSIGMIASSDHLMICTEMDRLEKTLNKGCGK